MSSSAQTTQSNGFTPPVLELTEVEETLRRLLLDVAEYIDSAPIATGEESQVKLPEALAKEKLVLRYTGGWVRDKLLGVESHDIDVAINKMTGYQFGLRMKEYLDLPGNPEKYGLEGVAKTDAQSNKAGTTDKSKVVGGLHKIEANPEKSKHLETVTTRILGLDIDLVNLRKETYTDDSRNPQMEFGTPEEDALRRDATVNAMFYNLNTRQIEDFTGQGHIDMKAKIIRTPLEPYQTFKDDPLRVLRLIRFASRLAYVIEPSAQECMKDVGIQDALRAKISRERVGVELEKMLRGPDPYMATSIIQRLELYRVIFADPTDDPNNTYRPEDESWDVVIERMHRLLGTGKETRTCLVRDREEEYLAWTLSCMVPFRDAPQAPPPEPGRKQPPPFATNVAREGFKATNKVCELVTASLRNREEITKLVNKQSERRRRPAKSADDEDPMAPDVVGMAIRKLGPTWRSQTVFAMLCEIAEEPQSADVIVRNYEAFASHANELKLSEAYDLRPLIDGKTLAKALQTKPGPWMKEALDVVMAWQLRNPDTASTEGAIEEVKNLRMHGELTADLVNHFLRLTIRPLFAKNQHPAVTKQGRKVTTTVLPKRFELEESDEVTKPWKFRESHGLSLLHWVVQSLDDRLAEKHWPMLVPPLLSITDDHDTRYKAQGCEMIAQLLEVAPSTLLARTGLGQVFEEALMPCLGYLPSLTPEKESISLLSSTYPALIALSKSAYQIPTNTRTSRDDLKMKRIAFLDTIMRKGVFAAYAHCSENVKIVDVLLQNLGRILMELGIESVKHLKYVLSMLNQIMSSPFGTLYTPVLTSAVKAMQAVILNGWPRMAANRAEVLKGLTLCWLQVQEAEGSEVQTIKTELVSTIQMLRQAIKDECDLDADFEVLIAAHDRLVGLLKPET